MKIRKLMKKIGIPFSVLLGIFLLFVICKIIIFRIYMLDNVRVTNDKVRYDEGVIPLNKNVIDVKINEEAASKITQIKDEKLFFNGMELACSREIYEKNLRLYIPLEKVLKEMTVTFHEDNNIFNIGKSIDLYVNKNYYEKNNEKKELRGNILTINNEIYISLNDLEEMLNFRDKWSDDFKNIYLFDDEKIIEPKKVKNSSGKVALIRFEDVAAGGVFGSNENREKLKIMSDYLYSEGIIFHLGWVPRYVNPKDGVDNDFFKNHCMSNVHFINVLDHLINRGAIIGLHGYTHQYGDSVSTIGSELSATINNNEESTRRVAENAIKTAKTLNIPYNFFETPHYHATRKEQRILEEYFHILYEPYAGYWNLKPLVSLNNKSTLYVPTPLGYVQDDDGTVMARRIVENSKGEMLSSLFIHPFKELKYIELKPIDNNGYGDYIYKKTSPLHNIVQALNETGQITINVNSLN